MHCPLNGFGAYQYRISSEHGGHHPKDETSNAPQRRGAARACVSCWHQSGELPCVFAFMDQRRFKERTQILVPSGQRHLRRVDADRAELARVIYPQNSRNG